MIIGCSHASWDREPIKNGLAHKLDTYRVLAHKNNKAGSLLVWLDGLKHNKGGDCIFAGVKARCHFIYSFSMLVRKHTSGG